MLHGKLHWEGLYNKQRKIFCEYVSRNIYFNKRMRESCNIALLKWHNFTSFSKIIYLFLLRRTFRKPFSLSILPQQMCSSEAPRIQQILCCYLEAFMTLSASEYVEYELWAEIPSPSHNPSIMILRAVKRPLMSFHKYHLL